MSEAVKKSINTIPTKAQVLCLGEEEGFSNIFTLLKDVNDDEIPEPVSITNPDKEKIMVFWSSGTSG